MKLVPRPSPEYRSRGSLSTALESLEHIESVDIEKTLATLIPDSGHKEHFLETALLIATKKGLTRTVNILLQNGANQVVDTADDCGNTPLIMAAIHNRSDILSLLLQTRCNVNMADMSSRTALHWVALNGDEQAAAELLHHGALADKTDSTYNFTPLMLSARQGHTGIVRLLLEHNCDVNRLDNHGETPLFDAVRNNNVDCVELLLQAGACVNALDIRQRTPLSVSIQYFRTDTMRQLIAWNCDVNIRGMGRIALNVADCLGSRYSPLEIAIIEALEDQCEILVTAGADTSCLYHFLHMRTDFNFISGKSAKEWMRKALQQYQLRSLKDLARISIRKFYGPNFPHILNNLPLPRALKMYLTIPEVTQWPNNPHAKKCDLYENLRELPRIEPSL